MYRMLQSHCDLCCLQADLDAPQSSPCSKVRRRFAGVLQPPAACAAFDLMQLHADELCRYPIAL